MMNINDTFEPCVNHGIVFRYAGFHFGNKNEQLFLKDYFVILV